MKPVIAALLAAGLATGTAHAEATPAQAAAINQYAPDVDVSMMSDQQVAAAFAAANGSDTDAEKRAQIAFIAGGGGTEPMTFSEAQIALLEDYVPPDVVAKMSGQQIGDALAIISRDENHDQKAARIKAMVGN
ncbi:hypothetical protein [Salipiger mangrovisoli]|uniref:DUF4168 domain-containing protein n=1 Tax=Salipiger mangrovisoli TaxID=2865933 RepID=A0ABR9X6A3_9RHOB|nr:hypothetical protein [Salipiger mangrovisoli]MBE9639003.1 hypothetical protein [Salipiger mangrovisoli]